MARNGQRKNSTSEPTATRAATLIIQYGAYLILAAYLMTVTAAPAWTWPTRRRPLPLAVLAAGVLVLGYVLYPMSAPFPAAPFGWVVATAAASAAAGAAILLIPSPLPRMRRSPLLGATATATHPVLGTDAYNGVGHLCQGRRT